MPAYCCFHVPVVTFQLIGSVSLRYVLKPQQSHTHTTRRNGRFIFFAHFLALLWHVSYSCSFVRHIGSSGVAQRAFWLVVRCDERPKYSCTQHNLRKINLTIARHVNTQSAKRKFIFATCLLPALRIRSQHQLRCSCHLPKIRFFGTITPNIFNTMFSRYISGFCHAANNIVWSSFHLVASI